MLAWSDKRTAQLVALEPELLQVGQVADRRGNVPCAQDKYFETHAQIRELSFPSAFSFL